MDHWRREHVGARVPQIAKHTKQNRYNQSLQSYSKLYNRLEFVASMRMWWSQKVTWSMITPVAKYRRANKLAQTWKVTRWVLFQQVVIGYESNTICAHCDTKQPWVFFGAWGSNVLQVEIKGWHNDSESWRKQVKIMIETHVSFFAYQYFVEAQLKPINSNFSTYSIFWRLHSSSTITFIDGALYTSLKNIASY